MDARGRGQLVGFARVEDGSWLGRRAVGTRDRHVRLHAVRRHRVVVGVNQREIVIRRPVVHRAGPDLDVFLP
jgi:hypothetical protein